MDALTLTGVVFGGIFFILIAVDKISKAIEKEPPRERARDGGQKCE